MPRRPPPVTERQYTIPEAASLLQVSEKTVRRMISDRRLRAYKIGAHIRIDPADLGRARTPVTTH